MFKMKKKKVYLERGTAWTVEKGERKGINSLEQGLETLAECCGVSCYDNLLRLKDKVTGDTYSLFWKSGVLTQKNETTGIETPIHTEPDPDPEG